MPGERNQERIMEFYDVLRTTFAAREFTDDPLPDEVLFTILDRARFAPSGGNRQGWRVIVVRDSKTRQVLAELTAPAAKRYAAQLVAEEPKVQELLGIPRHVAVCAVMPLGRPVRPLTSLRRKDVPEFTMRERWGGPPLAASRR